MRKTTRNQLRVAAVLIGAQVSLLAGCQSPVNEFELKQRAVDGLLAGARFEDNPAVRVQAIEALQETAPNEGLRWIQEGLRDEEPAVRFAACVALGKMKHTASRELLQRRLTDTDYSVQAAAIFALHMMGDKRHTSKLAQFLSRKYEPGVRNNAAFLLGELGDPGAIPLLRRQVRDETVTLQVVEAMAELGDDRAFQQLTIFAHDGRADRQIIALIALGRIQNEKGLKAIEFQFLQSGVIEVRLAAARALGRFGRSDGYDLAMEYLNFNAIKPREGDTVLNQNFRLRSMSAHALGAIGDKPALPALRDRLEAQDDPRVQLAAAKAILDIIGMQRNWLGAPMQNSGRGR